MVNADMAMTSDTQRSDQLRAHEATTRVTSEFLANMSHELRTPLNAIIGFSEIMQSETLGPIENERYKEYVQAIHRSGCHLLAIISEILDLSKLEAGKYELHETAIDITRLFNHTFELVKPQALEGGIRLSAEVPKDTPDLWGDENKVRQMLLNLVANAVKFTPAGGDVVLSAKRDAEGRICLCVTDSGIGIADEDIDKAMMPFGQVDGGLDRKYEGTGLGLPLAKTFADIHHAELSLESEIGVGTVVTVAFPIDRIVQLRLALAGSAE